MTIRIWIIEAEQMGQRYTEIFWENPNSKVVAVEDVLPGRVNNFIQKYEDDVYDYSRVIFDIKDIHAVTVCLPY